MERNEGEVLLLDPITTKKEIVKVRELADILSCAISTILNARRRKAFNKNLGMFLLPTQTTNADIASIIRSYRPDDEVWLDCISLGQDIKVSNYGRIARFKRNGNITIFQYILKKQKNTVACKITFPDGKRREFFPSRYIATMFLNDGKPLSKELVVVHKNGIKWDNRPSNLEIMHRNLTAQFGKLSNSNKYVAKVNPWTNEIVNVYKSFYEASRANNISASCISYSAKHGPKYIYGRHIWKEISEEDYYDLLEKVI